MKSTNDRHQKCKDWYNKNYNLYLTCKDTIENLLKKLIEKEKIAYHSVESRIKSEDSFLQKCMNEKYQKPLNEITDLCGLRIITYTNQDVLKICQLIEKQFKIDRVNSVDKSKQMDEDQVGYLSIHYIASLTKSRSKLEEYKSYSNLKFEIQIRTLLQHAWAEIEHDRNYKFSGELPREIKRRFYLVAGTLELLDREFEQLSYDIDKYALEVRESTEKGDLNVPIDSTSLLEYLNIRLSSYSIQYRNFHNLDKQLILELQEFGIKTLKDLEIIIDETFIANHPRIYNYLGLLRDLMIFCDCDKYFNQSWQEHWYGMDRKSYLYLKEYVPQLKNYSSIIDYDLV